MLISLKVWLSLQIVLLTFCVSSLQLAKKIREKFNRYLDVVNRNKQVVEASYTAHLTSPLTAIQDCCSIPASMMEWVVFPQKQPEDHKFHPLCHEEEDLQDVLLLCVNAPPAQHSTVYRGVYHPGTQTYH